MSDFVSQILGAMEKNLDERFNSFETAIPGIIKRVRKDGRVDVTPSIRKMVTNGVIENFDLPIRGIPVMQIGFSGMNFDLALSEGDSVVLLFFSRDAANWKKRKWGQSDPRKPLANDVNSCVAIPFVRPDSDAKTVVKIDKEGVVTFTTSRFNVTGDLVVDGNIVSRKDVCVASENSAIGTSLKMHVHPSAVGPTSAATGTDANPIFPEL